VRAGFIPGFPGDTRSRFMETAMVFRGLQKRFPSLLATGIEPFVVSPGQPIYQDLGKYGLTTTRWKSQYLDIAPEYRPITEGIWCTVEGANQGIERLGQYQIAITMSQDSLNGRRTQQHTITQDSADFMHYSYNPEELETVFDLTIEHVFANWYLGVFKTTTSLIYGCLLSHEEKALYQKLRAKQKLTRPWAITRSLLEQESMADFLRQVENKHLINSAREGPRIGWPTFTRDLTKLEPESQITISPFVIARRCRTDATDEIVFMNVINKRYYRAHESLQPLIELIKQTRQICEVRDFCEISELGVWNDVLQTMNELKEIGMLVTRASAVIAASPVEDVILSLARSVALPTVT